MPFFCGIWWIDCWQESPPRTILAPFRTQGLREVRVVARVLILAFGVGLAAILLQPVRAQQRPLEPLAATQAAVLNTYCVTCHNEKARTGGFSLENADLANIPKEAETWEKVIRKVRVGMMPPPGSPRPGQTGIGRIRRLLRNLSRSRGNGKTESRPCRDASTESCRIRECHPRPSGTGY